VSHPQAAEQIAAVNTVLQEIGAEGKPTIMVFNKIDRFGGNGLLQKYLEQFPKAVAVSASTGQGIPTLIEELSTQLRPIREFVELRVPHGDSAVIARLHEVAQVTERDYAGQSARFRARIPPHCRAEFAPYISEPDDFGKPT
jgi:GTP-binding protein HflX